MSTGDELIPFTVNGRYVGILLADFANDSDEPRASHKLWLEQAFIPAVSKHPGARLRLTGMASRNGDARYNLDLSRRRIDKVASFILSRGHVTIVERNPRGEEQAREDGFADGDRSGRYRAVLMRWEGLSAPPPPPPRPGPRPFRRQVIKTRPGVWLIIGLDTFGLPIKFLSVGRIMLTLLNDKGEQWEISGLGVGAGLGVEFGKEAAQGALEFLKGMAKNIGLKAGDIPNAAGDLKDILPDIPSATIGGLFRGSNIVSNFTISEITARGYLTVASGGLGIGLVAGEQGALMFDRPHPEPVFPSPTPPPLPLGIYSSVGTLKVAAELGVNVYLITGTRMKGVLEKEVLDL